MTDDTKGNTEDNMEYTEKAYATGEVATMLDISVPAVRKYAQILESKGYTFIRSKKKGKYQARLFVEKDVTALRYLKEIRSKGNTTVDQATSIVIERFGKGAIQAVRGGDTEQSQQYEGQYTNEDVVNLIKQQNELIKDLSERLDEQQEYINTRLKERDQALLQTLDDKLETRKQLASTQESEEANESSKPGFFARLFGKGKTND
ncbi:hypothetical protein GCM10028778_20790 [Barrientosiimonas marina]